MNDTVEMTTRFSTQPSSNIGKLLIAAGKLTEADVELISQEQQKQKLRFGEAAIQLGLLDETDIINALSRQFDYPVLPVEGDGFDKDLVAAYQPYSLQCEALRVLRSRLMLRWFDNTKKLLALTSDDNGHGCSQLVANLAIVFSQLGEKTLLIDTNLRNPNQHKLFGLDNQLGLSSILAGRVSSHETIQKIKSFRNLSIICAGTVPPNPQELLSREGFSKMLVDFEKEYDIILCDTSPALDNSDAQIVVARVGACVIVLRRNQTKMAMALHIREQIGATGAELLGVVVN